MKLFKESKKQPIKLRNFKFIGFHPDYETCCYYFKELPRDNFELMEVMLEGKVKKGKLYKPELGAGTKIQILDAFMSNYLFNKVEKIDPDTAPDLEKSFLELVIERSFPDFDKKTKESIIKKFSIEVPREIALYEEAYKKYTKEGYKLLYCSNDETSIRKFGIVNIVLVKEEHVKSNDKNIEIDRHYTLFKPLKYMTKASYIKGESNKKYHEEELPLIVINHDILQK
jgi:hypothetical protein